MRFSLRSLFLLLVVIGGVLAWCAVRAHRRSERVFLEARLREFGIFVGRTAENIPALLSEAEEPGTIGLDEATGQLTEDALVQIERYAELAEDFYCLSVLEGARFSPSQWERLFALHNLRQLELDGIALLPTVWEASARRATALERLSLANCEIDGSHLQQFSSLPRLKELDLSGATVHLSASLELTGSFSNLETLAIPLVLDQSPGDLSLKTKTLRIRIAGLPKLRGIGLTMDWHGGAIEQHQVVELHLHRLPSCESVWVHGAVGSGLAPQLRVAGCEKIKAVYVLSGSNDAITSLDGLVAPQLETLWIDYHGATYGRAEAVMISRFPAIRSLSLQSSDAVLPVFASAISKLRDVSCLRLDGISPEQDDAAFAVLRDCPSLSELTWERFCPDDAAVTKMRWLADIKTLTKLNIAQWGGYGSQSSDEQGFVRPSRIPYLRKMTWLRELVVYKNDDPELQAYLPNTTIIQTCDSEGFVQPSTSLIERARSFPTVPCN